MCDKVWISGLFSNIEIGMNQGSRTKYYGQDWNPASLTLSVPPQEVVDAMFRYREGFALSRSELPEAEAVFDEKRFEKIVDIFMIGPFYAVKGKLAEVLARFDLGEGGLIPFTIYRADLVTPVEENIFLLNFGARKNTILPEQSQNVRKGVIRQATGEQLWKVNEWFEEGDVVMSQAAAKGADLWMEVLVNNDKLFVSDALAKALIEIGMKAVFDLKACTIAGVA